MDDPTGNDRGGTGTSREYGCGDGGGAGYRSYNANGTDDHGNAGGHGGAPGGGGCGGENSRGGSSDGGGGGNGARGEVRIITW